MAALLSGGGLTKAAPTTSWTGPIPADATVTQNPGTSYRTYTWKVTDASGYTTTHWYTGPLGPDRKPLNVQMPQVPSGVTGRRPVSWTGPIPRDATITLTPGSSYKTYTWKVTDADGYTTTHWYSGPLGPDGAPARLNSESLLMEMNVPQTDTRRVSSESRFQQQHTISSQQQSSKGAILRYFLIAS